MKYPYVVLDIENKIPIAVDDRYYKCKHNKDYYFKHPYRKNLFKVKPNLTLKLIPDRPGLIGVLCAVQIKKSAFNVLTPNGWIRWERGTFVYESDEESFKSDFVDLFDPETDNDFSPQLYRDGLFSFSVGGHSEANLKSESMDALVEIALEAKEMDIGEPFWRAYQFVDFIKKWYSDNA